MMDFFSIKASRPQAVHKRKRFSESSSFAHVKNYLCSGAM